MKARLAGLWLLAGCAAGGPLPADVELGPSLGSRAVPEPVALAHSLPAADGSALPTSVWEPTGAPAKAVVLALHGYGDYGSSTFEPAAEAWAGLGIVTYAPDQRGFGRGPTRGRWPGAATLSDDAVSMARAVRERHPGLPLTVIGHSMGGGIVLAAADPSRPDGGLQADRIVLAAPAIWGGTALNPLHRAAAWIAAGTVPERRFTGRGVVRIQASDNIEALIALGQDPYYLSPPSARELFGLVRVTDNAEAAAERVRTPAMLLLGEKDQIVPAARVEAVFARLQGPAETRRYEDGWHLLFRDLGAEAVWSDVAAFALGGLPDS